MNNATEKELRAIVEQLQAKINRAIKEETSNNRIGGGQSTP